MTTNELKQDIIHLDKCSKLVKSIIELRRRSDEYLEFANNVPDEFTKREFTKKYSHSLDASQRLLTFYLKLKYENK